jgi:hypothetical protein
MPRFSRKNLAKRPDRWLRRGLALCLAMGGCTVFTEVDWSLIEPPASGEGGDAAGGENSNGASSNGASGGQDNEGGEGGTGQGGEAGDGSGGTPNTGGAMVGGFAGTAMGGGNGGTAGTGGGGAGTGGGGSGGSSGNAGAGGKGGGGGVSGGGGVAGMGGKAGAGGSGSGTAGVGGVAGSGGGTAGASGGGAGGLGGAGGNGGVAGSGGNAGSGGSGGSSGNSGVVVLFDGGVSSQNMVWGGRPGLDAICASKKLTLALPQTQSRAYITVSATDEIVTMPARYGIPTNVPVVGPTGIQLGFTWSSLIGEGGFGGQLFVSLVDADVLPDNALLWLSGSAPNGAFDQNHTCNGWTFGMADATIKARAGSPTATNNAWMSDAQVSCDAAGSHVLCVAYNP